MNEPDRPASDEPGSGSTPAADGQDTVDLGDRTGAGSPAANQGTAEPFPPGASGDEPGADPDEDTDGREQADVGADHPQGPRPA